MGAKDRGGEARAGGAWWQRLADAIADACCALLRIAGRLLWWAWRGWWWW